MVLPTYNEAENIEPFLRAVRSSAADVAVLVVDDQSPDGTGEQADRLATELGGIEVLHRTAERGLGSAYREGFARVLARPEVEVVVSMDADFSHDPASITRLVGALGAPDTGAALVIGSRYVPGGDVVNWPLHRRLLSRWGNRYTSWALGLDVRDCTSGFRAYRASALRTAAPASTTAEGYAFLTELVRRITSQGDRVVEVPITFVDRRWGTSKMSWRIVVESMLLVTKWGLTDRRAASARRRRR